MIHFLYKNEILQVKINKNNTYLCIFNSAIPWKGGKYPSRVTLK